MTAETIHTCSYSCERPECIRAQRDELAARLTAETSNARGEWVLVPRVPSAGMLDSAENAMIESEWAYNAGEPDARSDAHGFPTMRIWQAVVAYRAMLAAAPPPADAHGEWVLERLRGVLEHGKMGDKCLIAPDLVTAAIAALSASQPPAEAQERPEKPAECADGCPPQQVCDHCQWPPGPDAEAQAQGGGEVAGWVLEDTFVNAKFWTADTPPQGWTPVYYTAPPSAPVGVEGFEQWYARVDARFWNNWDACNAAFHAGKRAALAQQPAAVDEARGVMDVYTMQTIADAAAALDKRGDRQMAARLIRLHTRLLAAQHQEPKS